jgi:Ca-activated chloride channel homolog
MMPLTRGPRLAAILVLAGALAAGAATQSQERIRGGVDLVSLNITVTEGPRYVTDLEEADFEVFEDGVHQELSFFTQVQQPIALAVLLDTSASMEGHMGMAQEAAIGLARRMRPGDLMEVVDFNGQVTILQTFTDDLEALERAIRQTVPNGSTALYNAIYISLRSLQKMRAARADDTRRQAIVLLSDGDDTSSLVAYDEVLDLAKRSETVIYAVGLRPNDGMRRDFKRAEFVLRELSQATGGRVFYPTSSGELPRIYAQIGEELANQYAIGYSSSNPVANGAWRRVSVRVARPGMVARTRPGYFAPGGTR